MADGEQNKQSDFMIEKIKNRPINKKKLLRRTVTTAVMAVIFGLVACLTFLILEPVFSNWLYPEEEPPKIIFPEEEDEIPPEDMLVEEEPPDSSIQEEVETILLEDEGIREILENIQLDQDNYIQLYNIMAEYAASLRPYMVTVTAVTSNEDWLNNVNERLGQTYGTIMASNGKEWMILTDWATIRRANDIRVTFCDGNQVEATVKQTDEQTGLAVISVMIDEMPQTTRETAQVVTLGSSNMRDPLGIPVVAMGCPLGTVGSIGYGMIAGKGGALNLEDANYRTFITDIYGSENAAGALFDMQGKLIGIITPSLTYDDMPNAIMAIGISDLRKLIENMSNEKEAAYLGISAIDVTAEANQEMQVPFGAYVRDIAMDSPAMLAGIQRGDVIVEMDGSRIDNCINYTSVIQRLEAGQTIVVVVQRLSQDSYRRMEMEITLEAAE